MADLQKDKRFLQERLKDRERAAQQISRLILEAESQRTTGKRKDLHTSIINFGSLKGKMSWPAKGEIITHFGEQRHPLLKTVTENLGIEIKSQLGAPVCAVDDGEVWTITWQRGRGNIGFSGGNKVDY